MDLRHLRCFLAVAEELHFGRAAQRLSISQPPLSLTIRQLEDFVGAQLFIRNSKEVRLTAAGAALVPHARVVLDQVAEAARHAHDVARGVAGRLHVGFVGAMLFKRMPQLLKRFQAAHPGLKIILRELNSQDQLVELAHDQLDIGFNYATRVPEGMAHLLISSEPFLCCLPEEHPLARHEQIALGVLRDEPFVLFTRTVSPEYYERILTVCHAAGFHPEVRHEVRHWLSVVSLVSQGMGVALVPAALRQSAMPGAVFVPLVESTVPSQVWCVWKRNREEGALARLLDEIRSTDGLMR